MYRRLLLAAETAQDVAGTVTTTLPALTQVARGPNAGVGSGGGGEGSGDGVPAFAAPLLRAAPRAGRVVHEFMSASGDAVHANVADWQAMQETLGGWGPGSGVISETMFRRHRECFDFGAHWYSYLEDTGECISAGRVTEPDISGGVLVGHKGRAWIAERMVGPVLYRHDGPEGWTTLDSDPFTQERSDVIQGAGVPHDWTLSLTPTVTWRFQNNSGDAGSTGMPILFYSPESVLTQLRFRVFELWSGSEQFRLSVGTWRRPQNVQTFGIGDAYHEVLTPGQFPVINDGHFYLDVDVDLLSGSVKDVHVVGVWPSISPADIETSRAEVELTLIQLWGEASERLTASGLVEDIAARMGVRSSYVEPTSYDILPYELDAGTPAAEALDYASLLTGFVWRITGERPVLEFRDPRDRTWIMDSKHAEYDPIPQERYDVAVVPFIRSDGRTEDFRRVTLDPSPLDRRSHYGTLEMARPLRNNEVADILGQEALHRLARRRHSGDFQVATIRGEGGGRHSAHLIQAGDRIDSVRRGDGGPQRIATITHSDEGVHGTFDDGTWAFDRYLARRNRRRDRRALRRGRD